jgi:hypothetical protein
MKINSHVFSPLTWHIFQIIFDIFFLVVNAYVLISWLLVIFWCIAYNNYHDFKIYKKNMEFHLVWMIRWIMILLLFWNYHCLHLTLENKYMGS